MISVVTLVNNKEAYYVNVVNTLKEQVMEFVPIFFPKTASSGLNEGIKQSKGDIIVCCHQDVVFPNNWVVMFEEQIKKIYNNNWGVLGTYGVSINGIAGVGNVKSGDKELKGTSDIYHNDIQPRAAMSLDEHCLILQRKNNLFFDEDLQYFHMYGADICLISYSKNLSCYAIDAKVHHLSDNLERSDEFKKAKEWFVDKWKGKTRFRKYRTTCCVVNL